MVRTTRLKHILNLKLTFTPRKKDRTADLVHRALTTGFKGIDVAAQPRHYREDLVGEGLRRTLADDKIKRGDLFIQTKYTSLGGQDPNNLPYNPDSSIAEQVRDSIQSSLHNLRVSDQPAEKEGTYIDSLVLHSPLPTLAETLEAWRTCEEFVPDSIKFLGISNTTLPILQALYKESKVKPSVVQNRFYADTEYEVDLRAFCRANGIVFQSFWTLTGNPKLSKAPPVLTLAKTVDIEPAMALYCLVLGLDGTVILNGTQNHMASDLEGLERVREWALANSYDWENTVKHFKDLTGDNKKHPLPADPAF